jgi:hypothetical protein
MVRTNKITTIIPPYNLTTALIMGAVVLSVGGNNVRFISIAFVNIVVRDIHPSNHCPNKSCH